MAICQFFLQGRCRFGDRCWNEHPRGGGRYGPAAPQHQGTSGGGGAWGTTNQRYTSVIQPSTFKSNTWGGSRDHGRGFFGSPDFGSSGSSSRNASFSQNRFSALMNSQNTADGYKDEEERLLESIVKDMEIWESSGQWIFSSYSPMKEKPNVSGFRDFSPEELHLEYYNCTANNNIQSYINSVQQLAKQWKDRLLQLKTLTASTKAALLSELKNTVTQPLPAFGFGGQQTSSFGLSSFPVISNSNSASSFSFKTSSSLISTSSGNTPAFGSSSASCNPPPFGVTSSPSVSHSVGFGSLAAPSAASSFKTSATTSGFGTSGFSGFGNSSAVNFSGTTLLTALGASNAAAGASSSDSSSTLFGQTASNAAVGTSSSTLFGQTASNAAVGTSSSDSSSTLFGQTASNAAVGTSSSTLFGQTASNAAVGTSSSDSSSTLSGQTASNAAVGTSPSDSSSTSSGQTASASGHNVTSASSAVTNNTTSEKLFTPKSELSAEELKQFEAKKFTVGKIPFKPPPSELLNV